MLFRYITLHDKITVKNYRNHEKEIIFKNKCYRNICCFNVMLLTILNLNNNSRV